MRSKRLLYLWTKAQVILSARSFNTAASAELNFESDFDALANDESPSAMLFNTDRLSFALQNNASSRTLVIPSGRTFYLRHGVVARNLHDSTLRIDGTLSFRRDMQEGPAENLDETGLRPTPCILLDRIRNVTVTSSIPSGKRGVVDGGGPAWWGLPGLGYLLLMERRPRLLEVHGATDMIIENVIFRDPPIYTLKLVGVDGLTIRFCSIVARRTKNIGHGFLDMSAFNTDAIDVGGHNVHVHDVDIWNQDDCIAVKDNGLGLSSNMTFERINASGVGLTIGSIGRSSVRNITFRDSYIYRSFKGIYLKFRETKEQLPGLIENVLFHNITVEEPLQWGIWIGPAQQAISGNPCNAHPCSLCWPTIPNAKCYGIEQSTYRNITLSNVRIHNPQRSPGVIMGHKNNPIDGLLFDNVVVTTGRRSALSELRLAQTFPGLAQPVHDNAVVEFEIGFVFFVLLFGIAPILLCIRRGLCCCGKCRTSCDGRERGEEIRDAVGSGDGNFGTHHSDANNGANYRHECRVCFFTYKKRWLICTLLVCVASLSGLLVWMLPSALRASNVNGYFACEGVSNGIATGDTSPVPSCFLDRTGRGEGKGNEESSADGLLLSISILLSCCVLCTFGVLIRRLSRDEVLTHAIEDDGEHDQHAFRLPLSHLFGLNRYELVETGGGVEIAASGKTPTNLGPVRTAVKSEI